MLRALALAALLAAAAPADARDLLPGPYPAKVLRVYDGDTFLASVHIWLDQDVRVWVRLLGIDTPELGRRARCAEEARRAEAARARLEALLESGKVELRQVQGDKYAGRVDASVIAGGTDVAATLIAEGHGRPYDGRARQGWCG